jgi:hypothetical protein
MDALAIHSGKHGLEPRNEIRGSCLESFLQWLQCMEHRGRAGRELASDRTVYIRMLFPLVVCATVPVESERWSCLGSRSYSVLPHTPYE